MPPSSASAGADILGRPTSGSSAASGRVIQSGTGRGRPEGRWTANWTEAADASRRQKTTVSPKWG